MSEGYDVEAILNKREMNGEIQYLVKWVGLDNSNNSWVLENKLENCKELIDGYNSEKDKEDSESDVAYAEVSSTDSEVYEEAYSGYDSDGETGEQIKEKRKQLTNYDILKKQMTRKHKLSIKLPKSVDSIITQGQEQSIGDVCEDSQLNSPRASDVPKSSTSLESEVQLLKDFPPDIIYGCTKTFGVIRYYIHSNNKNYDVCSEVAKAYIPHLVLKYLENKIVFN